MERKIFIIKKENIKEYIEKITIWIKNYVERTDCNGVVLGMSGGVDCSVVARLCQKAKIDTHLIIMPYGENTKNIIDAMELINKFNFKYHIFNIKPAVDALTIPINVENNKNINLARANIMPRVRMTYLYQYAQINNLLVIGTGNLSERTVGYFTKWGDGAYDINPLGMLTKKEVYLLAEYLQIPNSIINKKPSADLWEGQTDEEELGITYNQIDNFILEGTSGDEKTDDTIRKKIEASKHKINKVPIFND